MNPKKLFPLIVTSRLDEVKSFYTDKLGWEIVFDMEGYKQFRQSEDGPELCFMAARAGEALGVELQEFGGRGIVVSVPIADPDAEHERLAKSGVEPTTPASDKPWGWRSFIVEDPTGLRLDLFRQAEQAAAATA